MAWPRPNRADLTRLLAAAIALTAYQTFFAASLYHAKPAFVSLMIQLELIVAIGLSCLFFADERLVVRSPWFILGALATFAGAVGMVVFGREFTSGAAGTVARRELLAAVMLVGSAAALWGVYSVAIKWCLQSMAYYGAFFTIELLCTASFLVLAVGSGELRGVRLMPGSVVALMVGSGIACIAIAHILYMRAMLRLGVVVCNTVILASPVVAAIASRLLFAERLTVLQGLSGGLILAGAAAAVHARARPARAKEPRGRPEKDWTGKEPSVVN